MKKIIIIILCIFLFGGCHKAAPNEVGKPIYPAKTKYSDIKGSKYQGLTLDFQFYKSLQNFSYQSSKLILDDQKNQMYSPISLYMALSMLAEGATKTAQDEILLALQIDNLELLRNENKKLYQKLYFENEVGKLLFANSIWLNKEREFVMDTIDILKENYYAYAYKIDFSKAENGKYISDWIAKHTGGKLGKDESFQLNQNMIAIILNTIYFYDEWTYQFDKSNTTDKPFYSDKTDTVPFMINQIETEYFQGENYQLATLPFKNNGKMIFVLPDENIDVSYLLDNLETVFDTRKAQQVVLEIQVPKFSFDSQFDLIPMLEELGIKEIFQGGLDNLVKQPAFVSKIQQQSAIEIDEKGCEATAVTKIVIADSKPPQPEIQFILNRPFLFMMATEDHLPLFIGVVRGIT